MLRDRGCTGQDVCPRFESWTANTRTVLDPAVIGLADQLGNVLDLGVGQHRHQQPQRVVDVILRQVAGL
eukprot:SAG22_NODE_302_length_12743_cov_12.397738_6_plen_69_part_00